MLKVDRSCSGLSLCLWVATGICRPGPLLVLGLLPVARLPSISGSILPLLFCHFLTPLWSSCVERK